MSCLETPGVGFSEAAQAKQTDRNRMTRDLIGKPYCTSQERSPAGMLRKICLTF